jgi:hypothetical protein
VHIPRWCLKPKVSPPSLPPAPVRPPIPPTETDPAWDPSSRLGESSLPRPPPPSTRILFNPILYLTNCVGHWLFNEKLVGKCLNVRIAGTGTARDGKVGIMTCPKRPKLATKVKILSGPIGAYKAFHYPIQNLRPVTDTQAEVHQFQRSPVVKPIVTQPKTPVIIIGPDSDAGSTEYIGEYGFIQWQEGDQVIESVVPVSLSGSTPRVVCFHESSLCRAYGENQEMLPVA